MKTFPIRDDQERLFAFEVRNLFLSRRRTINILKSIEGVEITFRRAPFSAGPSDVFCRFLFDGHQYIAEEPFGDSSRYWIGPEPPQWLPQTEKLHAVFSSR